MPMDFRCMVFCSSRTRPDAASSALDGTQPRLTHVPPMSCPSMMATFKPWSAARCAIAAAQLCPGCPAPLPSRILIAHRCYLRQGSCHTVYACPPEKSGLLCLEVAANQPTSPKFGHCTKHPCIPRHTPQCSPYCTGLCLVLQSPGGARILLHAAQRRDRPLHSQ